MYKVEYLPSALKDMSEIISYITKELDNRTAAGKLSEKFIETAGRIGDFPYSNPVYIPIKPLKNEYRKVVVENYLMFYSVNEEEKTVTVSRVIYGKRNYDKTIE